MRHQMVLRLLVVVVIGGVGKWMLVVVVVVDRCPVEKKGCCRCCRW